MFKLLVFITDSKDLNQGTKHNWKANLFLLTEAWLYEKLPKFAYDLPSHKLYHAHIIEKNSLVCAFSHK